MCIRDRLEYYHNSSHLEHGGAPEKAVKVAFVSQIDAVLKQQGKYLKNESKITFQDVEDCLILVSSSFSTQTSYENPVSYTHLELVQYFGDHVKIGKMEAEALLSGIMLDTKNFVMKTGVRTFEAVSYTHLDVYKRQV